MYVCMYVPEFSFVCRTGYFIGCPGQPERYFWRACVSHKRRMYDILWGFCTEIFPSQRHLSSPRLVVSSLFFYKRNIKENVSSYSLFSQTSEFSPCHINIIMQNNINCFSDSRSLLTTIVSCYSHNRTERDSPSHAFGIS